METIQNLILTVILCVSITCAYAENHVDSSNALYESQKLEITVKTFVRQEEHGGYELVIQLTNNMPETIYIPNANFHRSNMILAIFQNGDGDKLEEERTYPDDPSGGIWKVAPGETIENAINLSYKFISLRDALKHYTLSLFWSLEVRPVDFNQANPEYNYKLAKRIGGFVEINQLN